MQIKKRAKSVQFGKKPEPKKESPPVHHQPSAPTYEHKAPEPVKTYAPVEQKPVEPIVEDRSEVRQPLQENVKQQIPAPPEAPQNTGPQIQEKSQIPGRIQPPLTKNEELSPTPTISQPTHQNVQVPEVRNVAPPIISPVDEANTGQEGRFYGPEQSEQIAGEPEQVIEQTPTLGGDTYIVEKEVKKSMLGFFLLIAIISFIIGILCMGAASYYLKNNIASLNLPFLASAPTPSPTPEPTIAPTPTPEKVDLGKYTIEIQNGSGITGEAAKLKTALTGEGFKVSSVANADNSDYAETEITASKSINQAYLEKLKTELSKTYKVSSTVKTASDEADVKDVTVIIGSGTAGQ